MSKVDEEKREAFLDLDRFQLNYDNGWRIWMRVFEVPIEEGRPHGINYALVLYNEKDGRVVGYGNAHPVDEATGPARRSRRRKIFDHRHFKDKSRPYRFETFAALLSDFWTDVETVLKEEGIL